jgi:hypothetical protein
MYLAISLYQPSFSKGAVYSLLGPSSCLTTAFRRERGTHHTCAQLRLSGASAADTRYAGSAFDP